ncbi:CAPN15 [Mytilus edulis]|uniref:CAPN15 n=1 Tax=Mytilus edulis TaxID=6550 RepID=A0A8S3UUH0_MYTED|nr:CAPN15 [Mytilus edulis]
MKVLGKGNVHNLLIVWLGIKVKELVKNNFLGVTPVVDKHRRPRSADNRLASRWKCCQCNHSNSVDEDVCGKCHHMKDPCCNAPKGKQWKCHACDNLNFEAYTKCSNCSKKRRDPDLPKPAKDLGKIKTKPDGEKSTEIGSKSPDKMTCERCHSRIDVSSRLCETCSNDKPRVTWTNCTDRPNSKPLRHDLMQSVRAKNLRTVKTKQVEAKWRKIVFNCQQNKVNFIDKEFPPTDNSLFKIQVLLAAI